MKITVFGTDKSSSFRNINKDVLYGTEFYPAKESSSYAPSENSRQSSESAVYSCAERGTAVNIQNVHFADLLDVQNILSAHTGISLQTEGHSFSDHLISDSVRVAPSSVIKASFMFCSVHL
jgi:hypothetical protein